MGSSKSVIDLFRSQGAGDVGLDEATADQMVANLNANTLPMCVGGADLADLPSDDVVVVFFLLDRSPSMEPVEAELRRSFNEILIPGLRGASSKTRQAMLVGGLTFDGKIGKLWGGQFHPIDQLPDLTEADYSTKRTSATAVYKAQLEGLSVVSVYAARVIAETNTPPKVIVITVSDGANNCPPFDAAEVKVVADKLSREIFVLAFAGFETYEPVDFREIAQETGFAAIYETKAAPGETEEQMRKRFRHLVGTISSSTIRQSQTVVNTTASQTFWQPGV